MEKRKRCNERAERMRKAYRRRLREEFGQCLSGRETRDQGSPASRGRQGEDDRAVTAVANKNSTTAATTTTGNGNRLHKLASRPIWLLRRQRSRWTCDSSIGSLESCSTDAGTPSTVGTSVDAAESPGGEHRRRRVRRKSTVALVAHQWRDSS